MPRLALVAAVLVMSSLSMRAAPDTVTVDGGRIAGTVDRGVRVFKGIPYAAPPVGPLRWRPPQAVVAWNGVRDASAFGAECPQTQYPAGSVYIRPIQTQSEDCLFLNVWTAAKAGDRKPVLFWIHGGALTKGSGISDTRDGVPLARKGVVLVSLNYRLGPLGYLAHPELTAESPQHSSGNYGVLDQIAALKWVQKHIAAFGGDPAAVTIAGESAGSWSVNTLVASPLARGLFIRAIGESGGRFDRTPLLNADRPVLPSAESVGVALARAAGAGSLAELRAVPADKLIEISPFRAQENVDGWVLPDEIKTIFARKRHNNVPVIVGSNANEITSLLPGGRTPQGQPMSDEMKAAYGVTGDADAADALLASLRDTVFSLHMRSWARATVDAGSKAYLYYFTHVPPSPRARELKAFHAGELPYVFNVVPSKDPREAGFAYTDVNTRLADAMSSYWVNFATTGDPNGPGLPQWPVYNRNDEPYLEFGDTITVGHHLLKRELDYQERVRPGS